MANKDIWSLFKDYDRKYFGNSLSKVKLSWSSLMTLTAGKTVFKVWKRGGTSCCIRLSQPLLSQRPHCDTVNTLLHEMIHAYLHMTQGLNYRDSHGPEFRSHMKRINMQEGSKITIYHNFEKEVNKFRVNVYRCDGPCVKKRPFFGILRRAIQRPPGPGDKWWAQHQLECGGTFHKIGGPGSPCKGKDTEMIIQKNKNNEKCKKPKGSKQNYKNSDLTDTLKGKDSISTKRKLFHKNDQTKKETFDENDVLKRIRDKYSNVKQTIMLSKETASQLSKLHDERSSYSHPSSSSESYGRYRYRYPAPFGNYVEGKINYNYRSHAPKQVKIKKYLDRYREAKKCVEPLASKSLKAFEPSHKKSISCDKTYDLKNNCKGSARERDFNYDYKSKTPDKVKLGKYINRYRTALHSSSSDENVLLPSENSSSKNIISLDSKETLLLSSQTSSTKKDPSSFSGSSKTTTCPICSIQIPFKDYDQHLGECFGNDIDFEEDFDNNENDLNVKGPNDIPVPLPASRKERKKSCTDYWDDMFAATNCKNCGSKVFQDEMQLHLQYCTDSDDESGFKDSPEKSAYQDWQGEKEVSLTGSLGKGFISCPSCQEKVKEEKIHEHLDECLTFVREEF
ncbi:DNA-dependent metalloprotease SPRTN-like [Palaemon carinicauda]|uniref:DNA-dependent metalloprotease SPRTN-like n=1 Tax=Palaemon carinicauda TaxID=392227 RepID=UPI0035B693B4